MGRCLFIELSEKLQKTALPGFPFLSLAAKWPKGSEKIARIWSGGGFVTVDVGVTPKFLLNILVVSRRL